MYDAVLAETITITGHGGGAIEAYSARPLTPGPVGGVVVLHHLPGYDRQTKEFTRSLAVGGFNGVPEGAGERQRQGRRDRPLLGRTAVLSGGGEPAAGSAVDCYGGFMVGEPPAGHPLQGWEPIVNRTPDLSCPLLGLFGSEDVQPGPGHVAELEAALNEAGKTYRFRTYEGANHGFLQVDSSRYHAQSAVEGWGEILAWFGRYLAA